MASAHARDAEVGRLPRALDTLAAALPRYPQAQLAAAPPPRVTRRIGERVSVKPSGGGGRLAEGVAIHNQGDGLAGVGLGDDLHASQPDSRKAERVECRAASDRRRPRTAGFPAHKWLVPYGAPAEVVRAVAGGSGQWRGKFELPDAEKLAGETQMPRPGTGLTGSAGLEIDAHRSRQAEDRTLRAISDCSAYLGEPAEADRRRGRYAGRSLDTCSAVAAVMAISCSKLVANTA